MLQGTSGRMKCGCQGVRLSLSERRCSNEQEVEMMTEPGFDVDAAHRHFSPECFDKAWIFESDLS